ncbi:MAG: cation:proton antiporter [Acidiferrobacterales bacterium]
MTPFTNVFYEIAALLGVAAVGGALGMFLRQPLIVAFIAVGILVGPAGFGWVTAADQVDLLAQMGIALLLFVVGLKLDLHLIRSMGLIVLLIGLVQVAITTVLGYALAVLLGLSSTAALYVGLGLAFSSTVIIIKLLSDKREIDALHGRIALGILIVQDLVVVLAMILLTAFGAEAAGALARDMVLTPLKGAAFLVAVAVIMRYVLPRLLHWLAHSQELLVLAAIAWAVALAAAGDALGFSKEVGAFVAGVSIASTTYREAIGARLTVLRDFLLLFFFIDLGAQLNADLLVGQIGIALALSAFVLLIKPLIIAMLLGIAGYRKRTLGLTALSMGQISEFSLILAAMGLSVGHLNAGTVTLMTLVALVTITLSSYWIGYSHQLYEQLATWLAVFERRLAPHEQAQESGRTGQDVDVILFGLGRYGARMATVLHQRGLGVLGVDFDPDRVRRCRAEGIPARYGDGEDQELPGTLPLDHAPWVVSSVPDRDVNLALLQALRRHGYRGRVALAAHTDYDAQMLVAAGTDLVLQPYTDAADQALDLLMGHDQRVSALTGDAVIKAH